jgi:hypothetical protein
LAEKDWHFMDPGQLAGDDPHRYLADPTYSGPGDVVEVINGCFGLSGPEYKVGPEVSARIATTLLIMLECVPPLVPNGERKVSVRTNRLGENSIVLENGDKIGKLTLGDKATALEALILRELTLAKQGRKRRGSLETANFILYKPETVGMPQQVWQTRVGGQALSDERVCDFSKAEKRRLGKGVGGFIAYLADVISPERYKEILEQAGSPLLFDRARLVRDPENFYSMPSEHTGVGFQKIARYSPETEIHPEVVAMQWELKERLSKLEGEGKIRTPIIGHDDLRPCNLLGKMTWRLLKIKREFEPTAVIDFESIMPNSPERVLRHVAVHGEEVIGPAEEAYGRPLDRELVDFWRDVQLVTVFIAYLHRLPATQELIDKLVPYLEKCLPDRDWRSFVPK